MLEDKGIDQSEIFNELRKDFEGTFVQELLPGILHNFANPLNGIMGRSNLLQRTAKKGFKAASNINWAEGNIFKNYEKINRDIDLMVNGIDRLSGLLNNVVGKICRLNDAVMQAINLSELIESEVVFFDFYLNVKHHVKKQLLLDKGIPEIMGVPSDYSIAFSALIRHSMNSMQESPLKKLIVSTYYDKPHVCVRVEDTGVHVAEDEEKKLLRNVDALRRPFCELNGNSGLFNALSLLKKYNALFQIEREANVHIVCVKIPSASSLCAG